MIILLIMAFGLIVLFEVPGLIRKRLWRELLAFSILLEAGFVFSLLLALGLSFPPITMVIVNFIKKLIRV